MGLRAVLLLRESILVIRIRIGSRGMHRANRRQTGGSAFEHTKGETMKKTLLAAAFAASGCIVDLGQQGMMTNANGLENMIGAMKAAGVSDADIDKMMRKNPARLLGL